MHTVTVSRVFAIAAREVMPTLVRRHQSYTYVEQRCGWLIGTGERMLETSIQRLALCASALLRQGFVAFEARARASRSGGCRLSVRIGGAGPLRPLGDIEQALAELGMRVEVGDGDRGAQLRRAHGICPATKARVEFACLPRAGLIFNAFHNLSDARLQDQHDVSARSDASPPRLWLLHPDVLNAASLTAQAQGHGWAVSAFTSVEQVRQRLRRLGPAQARPALFVCFLRDAAAIEEARALSELLPPATHRVGAIEIGAEWLERCELATPFELVCHPFCHDDWTRWTSALAGQADEASGTTEPVPLSIDDRILILIADDDEFSRELTKAMVHALGYDSEFAVDGQQAIECCRRSSPSLVVMDLEMPVMNGFEAIRQLRSLQQAARIAPCRIIAHSSLSGADAVRRALLAGADAFLRKPVALETLRAELRRWCVARHWGLAVSPSNRVPSVSWTPTLARQH